MLKNKSHKNKFKKIYHDVPLPPDWHIYETFKLDYFKYYEGGRDTAKYILDFFHKFQQLEGKFTLFEWGCGPARIIRHVESVLIEEFSSNEAKLIASDYNQDYVNWNKANIPSVDFLLMI